MMGAFATLRAAGILRDGRDSTFTGLCPSCSSPLTCVPNGQPADPPVRCAGGCLEAEMMDAIKARQATAQADEAGRYQGRDLDLGALMAEPDDAVPYIVGEFAARQAVTVLAGTHGIGKSAVAVTIGSVAHTGGGDVAGMDVARAGAVIFDAEQGRRVIRRRAVALGLPPTLGYVDAGGLDVRRADDRKFLIDGARRRGAQLVVADSLRRMAPGVQENEDAMVSVLEGWAQVAQKADAAVIVLAHRGKDTSRDYRGHSAIGDVADAVFVLESVNGDTDRMRRRLRCVKFRLDHEPEDRWLRLTAAPFGIAASLPYDTSPTRTGLADELLQVIATGFPISQTDVLAALGRRPDDKTGRAAVKALIDAGKLVRGDDGLRPAPGVVVQ